jgi:hypothetical protein
MTRVIAVWLATLGMLLPQAVAAQSLAEVAAKEKQRRKKVETPTTTYTERDLGRAGRPSGAFPAASDTSAQPAEGSEGAQPADAAEDASSTQSNEPEKTEEEIHAEAEKAWREKLEQAQEWRDKLAASLKEINDSIGNLGGQPYGSARQNKMAQLEEVKGQLAEAEQDLANLQEEGRRNRYRP